MRVSVGPHGHEENCGRKNHADWRHARKAARRLNRRLQPGKTGMFLAPYRCPICDRVHVGSLPKSRHRVTVDDLPSDGLLRQVRCLDDAIELDGGEG